VDKKPGTIQILEFFPAGIPIQQEPFKMDAEKYQQAEGSKKLQQVHRQVFAFQKAGQGKKVVIIGNQADKNDINRSYRQDSAPVRAPPGLLVNKKRYVHTPERDMERQNPVPLEKRLHMSALTIILFGKNNHSTPILRFYKPTILLNTDYHRPLCLFALPFHLVEYTAGMSRKNAHLYNTCMNE
jgi:hypothetical protein